MVVELPLSKKEMSITDLVAAHDKVLNMAGYANGDHMVKCSDDEEMTVNELVGKYKQSIEDMKKQNEGEDMDETMDNAERR